MTDSRSTQAAGQAALSAVAVETVAKMLLVDYDSEHDASHLSWHDFEPLARRLVAAIAARTEAL